MTVPAVPSGFPHIPGISPRLTGVKRLYLDTAPIIHFVDATPAYLVACTKVFDVIDLGQAVGITGMVTLGEVLVGPLQKGDAALADIYRDLLHNLPEPLIPIDEAIMERAADIRARYRVKLPDAIQLASGLLSGCDGFLTGDRDLNKVIEPGMKVFVLEPQTTP